MLSAEKIAVVIPCLNEADTIASLVSEVRKHLPSVFVIDDGSTDSTGELASASGAQVLRHDQPLGKGTALNTGLRRAVEAGFEWTLVMDGDGQHAPSDNPLFLEAALRAPLIAGNRMTNPGGDALGAKNRQPLDERAAFEIGRPAFARHPMRISFDQPELLGSAAVADRALRDRVGTSSGFYRRRARG